jgi:hypothetical protein
LLQICRDRRSGSGGDVTRPRDAPFKPRVKAPLCFSRERIATVLKAPAVAEVGDPGRALAAEEQTFKMR